MKVLTATYALQGKRKNDFCHAVEAEIVLFGSECDGESIDGSCGCRRSMAGMNSMKHTTTLMVRDLDIKKTVLLKAAEEYLEKAWGTLATPDVKKGIRKEMRGLIDLASQFKVNTVLEKRGNSFVTRGSVPEDSWGIAVLAGVAWNDKKRLAKKSA